MANNTYVDPNKKDDQVLTEQTRQLEQPTEDQEREKVGTIYNTQTSSYDTIAGNKESYSPNSEGKSNTGSGAEAAVGTEYSWNKQSSDAAQKTYTSDVLAKKQEMLTNRQTIENNAVNYQAQTDMMKYQNNQNAEKVGWTGGYVLDQNRQMEYLKQSIQAQMYGAMELQKYGYDSALAAARLSYDLNQQEYARQYYEQAVSQSLSEAQLTGVYFSAETKDMMSQLAVAEEKLKADPNDENAKHLKETIEGWFSSNGISKEGVKTLEAWNTEQAQELEWSKELWTRYQAAMESAKTDIAENNNMFIMLDENGKEMWDGTNVMTGNWETWKKEDVFNYIIGKDLDENGNVVVNQAAMNQYYSYLDSTLTGQLQSQFIKWCEGKKYIEYDENGNMVIKSSKFNEKFAKFLESTDTVANIFKGYSELVNKYFDPSTSEEEKKRLAAFQDMVESWDFNIELPDGTTLNETYKNLSENEGGGGGQNPPTTPGQIKYRDSNGVEQTLDYKWDSHDLDYNGKEGFRTNEYAIVSYEYGGKNYNLSFTTAKVAEVDNPNETNFDQDDISVKVFKGDAGGTKAKEGYGVEVENNTADDAAWLTLGLAAFTVAGGIPIVDTGNAVIAAGTSAGVGGAQSTSGSSKFNNILEAMYFNETGETLKGGTVIVINGKTYFYNTKADGPYKKGAEGLYGIQKQSCSDGSNSLKSALNNSGQWVNK